MSLTNKNGCAIFYNCPTAGAGYSEAETGEENAEAETAENRTDTGGKFRL